MTQKLRKVGTSIKWVCLVLGLLVLNLGNAQIRIIDIRDELVRGPAFVAPHSTLRPVLVDTLNYYPDIKLRKEHSRMYQAVVFRHLIYYGDSTGVNFAVDPVLNLQYGQDRGNDLFTDTIFRTNTRGIKLEGNIGKQFTFVTLFYESQSRYIPYVDAYVRETGASVGLGRTKRFKTFSFDYAMATGMVVYRPVKNAEIWFGHGKNFIGSGYRSLLLSDNAMNYPHLRLSYGFLQNKLRYQVIFASLSTGRRYPSSTGSEPAIITKGATFNYLTYSPSEKFELGLFEGTTWRRYRNGRQQRVDVLQANPIIGLNTITQGFEGMNNALVGVTSVIRPVKGLSIYGQLMYDGKQKQGYQLGISRSDLFVKNLFVRLEANVVSRTSYSQADSLENYTHFQQALAHPMGAGFKELVTTIGYRYGRIVANVQSSFAVFPQGYAGSGRNLVFGDIDHTYLSTVDAPKFKSTYMYVNPTIGFIINPSRNFQLSLGGIFRKVSTSGVSAKTSYIFVALSTNLNNLYFDF